MDGTMLFSSYYSFFIFLLMVHHVEKLESLRMELIHPFSPKSPYYKANITYSEMIKRLMSQPRTRTQSSIPISSNNTALGDMKVIRPMMHHTGGGYLAKLSLGTFHGEQPSYKTYYLNFDTASDIVWLQCEDCAKPGGHCFQQNDHPYPNSMSSSYAPLPCSAHPLCYPNQCHGSWCSYAAEYHGGSYSFGILAYETFNFGTSYTYKAETARIVIGCGIRNELQVLDDDLNHAGILGMSWGPHSFINQVNLQGRFSYCLPPLIFDGFGENSTILRFGLDTPSIHDLYSLPIHKYRGEESYYVNLQDISINNRRLNIPPRYFAKTGPNHGGTVFDTGTSHTFISRPAYDIFKQRMMHYLETSDNSLILTGSKDQFDLCYWRQPPFKGRYNHLPTVTFHFEGGVDLVLQRDIAFVAFQEIRKKYVCLVMIPASEDDVSVIGAQFQANHVVVYDLPHKMMYFGPRNCARNP